MPDSERPAGSSVGGRAPSPGAVIRAAAAPPRRPSPDSESAGAMGRGACVPSAAPGAGDQARRLERCWARCSFFPALVLLAWPGTPATRAGARAAQVRAGAGTGWGPAPRLSDPGESACPRMRGEGPVGANLPPAPPTPTGLVFG